MDDHVALDIEFNEFNLLSDDESEQLQRMNETSRAYRSGVTISDLFCEQAKLHPDRVAVIAGSQEISYGQLSGSTNQLAYLLRHIGGMPTDLVTVMTDRGIKFIASALAIFQNGMGYIPIDPQYPQMRVQYLLRDSGCKILITESVHLDKLMTDLPDSIETIITLDQTDQRIAGRRHYTAADIEKQPVRDFESLGNEYHTAYVIYTSGSTGNPKGVMITHKQVLNTLFWLNEMFALNERDVIAQKTSISFTDSVWELFWPLIVGAKLSVLGTEDGHSPELLFDWLRRQNITVTQFVPAMMKLFLSHVASKEVNDPLPRLKWVFNGGEAITADLVQDWNRLFQRATIANIYGMTESAIYATVHVCIDAPIHRGVNVPIGVPIANTHIYLISQSGELCLPGVKGEICIGGAGITNGYLRRMDLTEKAFTVHPLTGERLYRTGDIGVLNESFVLEYLGRVDDQVQVRGYRVELKEVERAIIQHPDIHQAAVIAVKAQDGYTDLIGYYVGNRSRLLPQELRAYVEKSLPSYMIPSLLIELLELPLTPHGKIDRNALLALDVSRNTSVEYVAPRNEVEQQIADIWSNMLHMPAPGIDDSFIELGGHSLKAIQLVSALEQKLGVKFTIRELLEAPTIRMIAEQLTHHVSIRDNSMPKLAPQEYYPVTPFQEQIYMMRHIEEDSAGSNSPGVLKLEGPLDKEKLRKAFVELVRRHEGLRTSFHLLEGSIRQKIHDTVPVAIEALQLDEQLIEQTIHRFVRPFDLGTAPLIRLGLIELGWQSNLLVIDIHHIVSDGISKMILMDEFIALYNGEGLPVSHTQPTQYAAWLARYESTTQWKTEENFWLNVYRERPPLLQLPTDYRRKEISTYAGGEYQSVLGDEWTERLYRFGKQHMTSLYTTLFTTYSILLGKYGNQEDLVIGCDMDNRHHSDFQEVVGAFTNLLAIRTKPLSSMKVVDYLIDVKNNVIECLENGLYPYNHLLRQIKLERSPARHPLVETMLTLHQPRQAWRPITDLQISTYSYRRPFTMLDLTLEVIDEGHRLLLSWQYNSSLFEQLTIERLSQDFLVILEQIIDSSALLIGDIQLNHGLLFAQTDLDTGDFAF